MSNIALYSFDIFDTLITRRVARPTGIFSLMQDKMLSSESYNDVPSYVKNNFFEIRTDAEFFLRRKSKLWNNWKDILFDDIYIEIQKNYDLTSRQIDLLKNLELNTEY